MSITASLFADIPQSARALTVFGEMSSAAVENLFTAPQASLFPPEDAPEFLDLAEALRKRKWSDHEVALLIEKYGELSNSGRDIDIAATVRWVLSHSGDEKVQAVIDCMEIVPPDEIDIIRVLSRKGNQKIVFLSSWRLRQQEVVVKKILGSAEHVERILSREKQPHPLTMVHPNIIETHFLQNRNGETFLVERKLPVVLSDSWSAEGITEAANLLLDIASAIKYLHENMRAHGDIKPDNIGKRNDHFVLLDFGICRLVSEFSHETTPTGSIRTRAPELLVEGEYIEPEKADVWALGATVYNALVGRFPLLTSAEMANIPRISEENERRKWEQLLLNRAKHDWSDFVTWDRIAHPLRSILSDMLERDVSKRLSSAEVVRRAEAELSAFLRSASPSVNRTGRFSPEEELRQIVEYMSNERNVAVLPPSRKQQLAARLADLKSIPGFEPATLAVIDELLGRLT